MPRTFDLVQSYSLYIKIKGASFTGRNGETDSEERGWISTPAVTPVHPTRNQNNNKGSKNLKFLAILVCGVISFGTDSITKRQKNRMHLFKRLKCEFPSNCFWTYSFLSVLFLKARWNTDNLYMATKTLQSNLREIIQIKMLLLLWRLFFTSSFASMKVIFLSFPSFPMAIVSNWSPPF